MGHQDGAGHRLMDAELAAYKAGNDILASCCLCELGNPWASIRIWKCWHRGQLRDMQRKGWGRHGGTQRQGQRNRWRKIFNPSSKVHLSGTAGCKPGTCALPAPWLPGQGWALSNSLGKTWHRLFVCALKMENGG